MAGLLAARAVSDAYDQVTVVERDELPEAPGHRAGVPQDRHVHTLWAGGMRAIERLVPDYEAELIAAGGCPMGFWGDFRWLLPMGRWSARWPSSQQIVSCSRVVVEHTLRRRIVQVERIEVRQGHEVTGLRVGADGAVCGVEVEPRGDPGGRTVLAAQLVIDASGRRSGLPGWLAAQGFPQPIENIVDPLVGYATRLFAAPVALEPTIKGLYIQLAPPDHTRGGIMFPVEDGQWVVTLLGACRDYPPTDDAGYLRFAGSLRTRELHDAIENARPTTPAFGHRHTANQRRRYERLARMPAGLLVLGDSLCAFNPIYGQGMTVAALQANTLHGLFGDRGPAPRELASFCRKVQRVLAEIADQAWMVSASEDLRYPVTSGPGFAIRQLHRYMERVMLAGTVDVRVAETFLQVLNMLEKPTTLQRPATVLRVLRAARRARRTGGGPMIDPAPERMPSSGAA